MSGRDKTDDPWRRRLTSDQYAILRRAKTEPPFSGRLLGNDSPGSYLCGACEQPLFASGHKFDSGSGWPSFWQPLAKTAVSERRDASLGLVRTEVLCGGCQSHLGHVFDDADQTPTGRRYCVNSLALKFKGDDGRLVDG